MSGKRLKIDLVIIDPQNSFCKVVPANEQQAKHDGELCVGGAWDDMLRVTDLVNKFGDKLNDIHVTLDSHHLFHIAHPVWWKDTKGNQPSPFTIMRYENDKIIGSCMDANGNFHDVGEYTTRLPGIYKRSVEYLKALSVAKRYPHCIWPPHCLIGTTGHNIVEPLADALVNWCERNVARINFVTKGSNPFVEHFSAVRAEVVDPADPTTQINSDLIKTVMEADLVYFAGEAGSHCLANTVRDMANEFQDDSFIKKCTLLTDGTSPVPGFESFQDDFIKEMTARGMQSATIAEVLS